jgi:hypothetical protein
MGSLASIAEMRGFYNNDCTNSNYNECNFTSVVAPKVRVGIWTGDIAAAWVNTVEVYSDIVPPSKNCTISVEGSDNTFSRTVYYG